MKKLFYIFFLLAFPWALTSCGGDDDGATDENALRIQEFVVNISNYAHSINPDFIVIPQNGPELAFNNTDPGDGINHSYLNAIDGMGIEELFYDGSLAVDNERLAMLRQLKSSVKIMVADYVSNNINLPDAVQRSKNEGFLSFPRIASNYDYKEVPTLSITDVNADHITDLAAARNYLYLISSDNFTDKQAMIQAIKATNYDLVLIDLFFDGIAFTPAEIQQLKTKDNGGQRLVIAYLNIGSAENYRYYWQSGWRKGSPSWIKKNYEGYPDEFWVEFWHPDWQSIIYGNNNSYVKKIIDAGFDGAYLDNVEVYYFLENDD